MNGPSGSDRERLLTSEESPVDEATLLDDSPGSTGTDPRNQWFVRFVTLALRPVLRAPCTPDILRGMGLPSAFACRNRPNNDEKLVQ
jgi:hypothetical protein